MNQRLCFTVASFLLPFSALAQTEAQFHQFDRNGDGIVTAKELPNQRIRGRFDQNGDGQVSLEEFRTSLGLTPPLEPKITEVPIREITSGPEILKPGEVGIGRMISDIEFADMEGESHRLSDVKTRKATVFAMTSATCPVSKRYLPTLAKLEQELAEKDIALILVNAFRSESEEEIRKQVATQDMRSPYVHDLTMQLTQTLSATTTTEVFLIDATQTLIYRGALDDQYGIDYSVEAPREHYLRDAIEALLANQPPIVAATKAPGCELNVPRVKDETVVSQSITYHKDVSRILQRNCVHCHHDDGIAPFSLEYLDEVSDRARVIRRVVSEGTMPPWFAAEPAKNQENPWANDHSLSARDKADLLAWLNSDQPEGNPADAPAPLSFPEEWTLGTPDLVIPLSKAYKIQATGFMPYQKDVVATSLSEDTWITGYEILPSERDVVHHVIVQVFEKGRKVRDISEAQGFWAAYVPGNGAVRYPDGFARKLPAGAMVSFQIHYTPSGEEKMERLRMGLHFADTPPTYEVKTLALADRKLNIPPYAEAHQEGLTRKLPLDIPAMSFLPHMHTRGSAFRYELIHQNGEEEMLLDIPRYDFNWQLRYQLKTPKILPSGSSVKVTGTFDNSTKNKANPDPSKKVRWGNQTVDEMLIGYIEYFLPVQEKKAAQIDEQQGNGSDALATLP
ncbi:MAG: redoxin domain-containing protein [Verrucomicrobiota bacterium]